MVRTVEGGRPQPTRFAVERAGRGWRYQRFAIEYRQTSRRVLGEDLTLSEKQCKNWVHGRVRTRPYLRAAKVLEVMFPPWTVTDLLAPLVLAPAPSAPLVGRAAEREDLAVALTRQGASVVVYGAGGLGKTVLVRDACHTARIRDRYTVVLWAETGPGCTPDRLVRLIGDWCVQVGDARPGLAEDGPAALDTPDDDHRTAAVGRAITTSVRHTVRAWHLPTGRQLAELRLDASLQAAAISVGAGHVLTASAGGVVLTTTSLPTTQDGAA